MKFILLPSCFIFILAVHFANQFPSNIDDYEQDYDEQKDEQITSEDLEEPVELWSKGGSIYVTKGSSVAIPCNMSNPSYEGYQWQKGNVSIFVHKVPLGINNLKYNVAENNSLIIPNIDKSDEDYYTCLLFTPGKSPLRATYHVQISKNPEITLIENDQNRNRIEIGTTLELICYATGLPKPSIFWFHNGQKLSDHNSLILKNVTSSDSGYYQCIADNHIGMPDHKAILITVLYKPQLKIDKLIVNSAEGYESQLICTANSEPQAKIYWIKDEHVIQSDDRINVIEVNGSLILQIKQTRMSDFGNYTCTAENRIGIQQETVTLTNKPSIVKFQEIENILDQRNVILVWLVESIAPIVRYELMYKLKNTHTWNKLSPQVVNPKNGNNLYEVRVNLPNLEFGMYEVKLKSENEYGWTEFSKVHYFTHPDDRENMISDQQEIVAGSSSIVKLSTLLISIIFLII